MNEWVLSYTPGSSLTELVDLVRAYAKQETIGELRGTGRWLAWGAIGGLSLLLGLLFTLVGVLRLLQSTVFDGSTSFSWVPYFIVLGLTIALKAFSAAIVGGLNNPRGCMLGGFLLGLLEALVGLWQAELREISIFVLIILVLVLKPEGLLGQRHVEKV